MRFGLNGTSRHTHHSRVTHDPDPAALFDAARAGDRAAFGQLVALYQDRLYNGVLRLVGDRDEARELVQEALLKALQNIGGHRGESGAYTWMFRIAMNLAISRLRKVRRHRTFSLNARSYAGERSGEQSQAERLPDDHQPAPGDRIDRRERDALVLAALGRLDVEYRTLIVLRDLEGFDYKQMAALLDLPLGTLKSRLFRARLALREELGPYFGVEDVGGTDTSPASAPDPQGQSARNTPRSPAL
ncbi:MAG: sigma-70 family RNA polymerase sigma factor [Planctomycetota bacterium]